MYQRTMAVFNYVHDARERVCDYDKDLKTLSSDLQCVSISMICSNL
jgi:hypothetical protein